MKELYHECGSGLAPTLRSDSKPLSADNKLYCTPVKHHQRSFRRFCSRISSAQPAQQASTATSDCKANHGPAIKDTEPTDLCNSNNNNNDDALREPEARLGRSWSRSRISRSKSFSEVLSLPRVETAFVGDEAYTVYHGMPRFFSYFYWIPSDRTAEQQ